MVWSYEYVDGSKLCLDSFMKPLDDLSLGEFQCLMVNTGFYCTSENVIHSFASVFLR